MSRRSVEHATFVVERKYEVSPEREFAAWADPEAKARWYSTPMRNSRSTSASAGESAARAPRRMAAPTAMRRSTRTSSRAGALVFGLLEDSYELVVDRLPKRERDRVRLSANR